MCICVFCAFKCGPGSKKTTEKKQIHKRHHLMELFDNAHLCICLFVYSTTKSQPNISTFSTFLPTCANMSANRHADTTPTRRPTSRHGAMSPTWSVSCWQHSADMSACLSFWGGKIPDTTPTLPAKMDGGSLSASTMTYSHHHK